MQDDVFALKFNGQNLYNLFDIELTPPQDDCWLWICTTFRPSVDMSNDDADLYTHTHIHTVVSLLLQYFIIMSRKWYDSIINPITLLTTCYLDCRFNLFQHSSLSSLEKMLSVR